MSRGKLKQAERLIERGNIEAGRKILQSMPKNETARRMLTYLDSDELSLEKRKPTKKHKFRQYTLGLLLFACVLCVFAIVASEDEDSGTTIATATQEESANAVTSREDSGTTIATATQMESASAATSNDGSASLYISANVSHVNVRSCAGANCPRVDCVSVGTPIEVIGFVQASDDSPWYNFSYEGGTAWVHADLTSAEPPNLQFAEPSGCAAPTPAQAAPIQPTQEQASSARVPPNTNHIESAITQAGYDVKSIIISPNLIQIEIDATRLALSDSTASGILDIETRDDMNIISTVLRTMRDSNYAIPSQIRVVYQVRSLPDLPVLCDFSNPESFVNGSITAEDYYWANCLIEYE